MEDSNPYESIDAKAHSEHQELFRGDQGVESDPAHQMMDNYVSTLLPVYLACSDINVKNQLWVSAVKAKICKILKAI